jgi:uncharacterized protein
VTNGTDLAMPIDLSNIRPSSPCVKICIMDGPSGLCEGCGRSLAEIGQWGRMTETERQAIMEKLPERLGLLQSEQKLPAC